MRFAAAWKTSKKMNKNIKTYEESNLPFLLMCRTVLCDRPLPVSPFLPDSDLTKPDPNEPDTDGDQDTIQLIELIPNRFYFGSFDSSGPPSFVDSRWVSFNLDDRLHYPRVGHRDFGPLDLSNIHYFCRAVHTKLTELPEARVLYWTRNTPASRANASVLLGCYLILMCHHTPEEVCSALDEYTTATATPMIVFCDASQHHRPLSGPEQGELAYASGCLCGFTTIMDVLKGIDKATKTAIYDIFHFDVQKYHFYASGANGNISLVLPGKLMAFPGPSDQPESSVYSSHRPSDYIPVFQHKGVTDVIRLNESEYDPVAFTENGIQHHDLPFPDGNVPPPAIVTQFLHICSSARGMVAVHCKAGLGRTGTCIALFLMHIHGWTAGECVAWLRICRPGSVIGSQNHFLHLMAPLMPTWNAPAIGEVADQLWNMFQRRSPGRENALVARSLEEETL